jgi:predicted metal-dependent peptidase
MTTEISKAEYNLSKAKAQLILEHPFYASLLCNLPFVRREDVKTMAVDGVNVYYNEDFVNSLTPNELKFAEAHEVMHCVFDHMSRKNGRSHRRWNMAGDYIINDMLVADRVGTIHSSWLYNQQLVAAGNYTTDGVYKLLPNDGGEGNGPMDDVIEAPAGTDKALAEQWQIRTVQAAHAAKLAGTLSAKAQRLVDQLVNPTVPWQEVLQRFVSKRCKVDRSFSRPNRRFIAQGVYLPAMSGETLGKIAIAVDCSGSISKQVLDSFATEIKAIKESLRPASIDVYYFDSEVSHIESYEPNDALDIKPHGGGGTAFSPIMRAINATDELPECLVVLTDLYCDDFGPQPDYPVLWVTNGSDEAPWGEVIKM